MFGKKKSKDKIDNTNEKQKWNPFVKKKGGLRFDSINRFRHWWVGGKSVTRSIFRMTAAWQGIAVIGTVLSVGYVMAAFYTGAGEFVIRVDHPGEEKLMLSDTPGFEEPKVLLKGTAIPEADNISIFDIDPEVDKIDGPHNGMDYIAHTFYIKNYGLDPQNYNYALTIRNMSKGIDKAVWVMLYYNGRQRIYAAPSASGGAESQKSEYEFPFAKDAVDSKMVTMDQSSGKYKLNTTPFASTKIVCSSECDALEPNEMDKYTVVIWLEGEDPECIDNILGGNIEMIMKFKY
ncbi:MAG: hypothetical protein PHE02_06110 [Lachnospiraceae bacterium]|nr:hypothetical protein [Lachnospiraceae bacterium]